MAKFPFLSCSKLALTVGELPVLCRLTTLTILSVLSDSPGMMALSSIDVVFKAVASPLFLVEWK